MIDVIKRLAELDATNPKMIKESQGVAECGPMGIMNSMPAMGLDKPSVPANFSINASAGSGDEVASMMSQILTLAGLKQVGADDLGAEPQGALVTAEPGAAVGPMVAEPMSSTDDMRSVLDKLNPEPAGEEPGEEDGDIGPFQHDSDQEDDREETDESDDEDDADYGSGYDGDREEPYDSKSKPSKPGELGKLFRDRMSDKETDEAYDNTPADPNKTNPFNSEEFANHENQGGAGETSNGEKRQSNLPTATFESLMKEYKQFIGEDAEEDEDMEEGIEDRLKDLDPKNPVNVPAYQRKAASGDSASAAKNTKESIETADILKLAGLK